MEQQQEPLQIPIINLNKISDESTLPIFSKCREIVSIILNLATWVFLILIIITAKRKKELKGTNLEDERVKLIYFCIFGAFSYLLHISLQNELTGKYLMAKDNKIINEKMGDIYKTNPSISLVVESYHFGGREGNVKQVSRKEEKPFNYDFCRDISGNFKLNINKDNYKYKYYAKLKIIHEIIFDDDLLFNEYNTIKKEIIDRNKNRDKYFEYIDNIELKGISNLIMVKLDEKEPRFVSCFWFSIFNILSLSCLYKLYICFISIEQIVTIKKLISRGNNNLPYDERYNIYNPRLQFLDKIFTYNQNGNILENNNVIEYNNAQRNLPINENQLSINSDNNINNNINNEQLNINNINIQVRQDNSLSTERCTNISNQE